jgi:NAD(P)-dependent dehydrogenase (short-subunit alcohol dehydrogenase family)
LSESLAAEVARFGIRVTIVEPGGYDTDWGGHRPGAASLCRRTTRCGRRWRPVPGGPAAAARALLEVVDAEEPPLRVLFGSLFGRPVTGVARATYDRRLTEWAAWEDLSMRAYGR